MDKQYLESLAGSPYVDEGLWNRIKSRTKKYTSAAKNIAGFDLKNISGAAYESLLKDYARKIQVITKYAGYTEIKNAKSITPDRKSTRLNSSHGYISYAVFCLK